MDGVGEYVGCVSRLEGDRRGTVSLHDIYYTKRKQFISSLNNCNNKLNGCGMGPLLVLVSPCFKENGHAKLGLFLCSLDNLLQKNVIVSFFENQISKWRSFERKKKKQSIFDLLYTFFSYQGKLQKFL